MFHALRALAALVLISAVAGHAGPVNADAMSDQKKAFKATGVNPLGAKPSECTIFTRSDAERVFHAPVVYFDSDFTEYSKTPCAWTLRPKDWDFAVLVSRGKEPFIPPQAENDGGLQTSQVRHVKGVGQDAYTSYLHSSTGGMYEAMVLTSKGVTNVMLGEKAGNADTTLAIARITVDR